VGFFSDGWGLVLLTREQAGYLPMGG
jgi:hypothetical protein